MKSRIILKFLIAALLCASLAGTMSAQDEGESGKKVKVVPKIKEDWKPAKPSPSFYIGRIENQPYEFNILLTDENNRNVFYILNFNRLLLFEAVLREAQKFAETEEAVGTNKPQVTRFVDKQEPAFIIDVSKLGRESHVYITLQGANGRLTIDAAKVMRGDKEKSETKVLAKIFELIDKVKSELQPQ